ncbi:helix-turn-helix domain-containing protein [Weissella viridescens]|uniref:helix-turn-helix domain-containing protein n=1 Tax=Weissella viridescens TaxID=1629 RepID=UPI001D089CF4|nr:helix-turn-helix domain-containing protein [Weissella viridescens]MCB6840967.1 helix-turn-helix domain-containing protein [Weissella viridescens]MCB6847701.1 helix-turn-helix domain-containing protein [Weissella viridescens]
MRWTDEHKNRVTELGEQGLSSSKIAQRLFDEFGVNLSRRTVSRYLSTGHTSSKYDKMKKNNEVKDVKRGTEIVINKDGSTTSSTTMQMTSEQAKDPEFVLRAHGFNPDNWDIVSARNNFWQQNSQENGLIDLYQSKITVKPKSDDELTPLDMADMFKNDIKPYTVNQVARDAHNLVVPLPDMHFGITTLEDVKSHLDKMLGILNKGYKTIVIEQLGDLFHSSQMWSSQTMRGTMLDEVDMVQAIEDAKQFFDILVPACLDNSTSVHIKQMAGNHSGNMEYVFMEYLKAKYPQVVIKNNIKYRGAYLLDNVGIMIAHGDLAPKNLPMLFANEFGGVWSLSHSREIHKGHFHNEKTVDEGGVISRQLGTVKPNDKYEISNGWTLSKKELYALEYDRYKLVAEWHV